MRRTNVPSTILALAVTSLASLVGCSVNPATGQRQLALMSEAQEIEMGRRAVPQVLASFGEYPDPEWQAYVDTLGRRLAAASERPTLPWGFHVLDDPLVNAFAYPGGQIYVTRGILSHFNSEAELASVLGHEIGHVTARHSVEQISQQQLAQLGLGIAAATSEDFRPYAGLAAAGLQVLFLKFSRDDERQSDDLGLRYMLATGYDPEQMAEVFRTFDRMQASTGQRIPDWQSTHPNPGNRVGRIEAAVAGLPPERRGGTVDRDSYLRRLDGMVYGIDPRHGYSIDNVFYHPDMAFRMVFPAGWKIVNLRQVVGAVSPDENAVVTLSLAREKTAADAARAFFAPAGIQEGNRRGDRLVTFSATNSDGSVVDGIVGFVERRDLVMRLLAYTGRSDFAGFDAVMERSLSSFGELRDRRYLDVQPARIRIVELPSAMTFAEFNRRYPSSTESSEVALINGVDADARLEAGRLMKCVGGGELPTR